MFKMPSFSSLSLSADRTVPDVTNLNHPMWRDEGSGSRYFGFWLNQIAAFPDGRNMNPRVTPPAFPLRSAGMQTSNKRTKNHPSSSVGVSVREAAVLTRCLPTPNLSPREVSKVTVAHS